jgi:glycosyltransferase involved in cell wall biosynthesis
MGYSMDKKVTVLMTSYNGEKFVEEQVESIIRQTHCNFELIIIDDMSTDNTQKLLAEFKDDRITLISNSHNIGCGNSFEKGLDLVKSEFVLLCDHDDIWEENKIEILLNEVEDNDLIYSDCMLIDENGDVLQNSYKSRNRLIGFDSANSSIDKICAFNSFVLGCSIMFRKETLVYITPILDLSHNHDKWIVALISQIGKIKYIDKKLFRYRIHGNNFSIGAKKSLLKMVLSVKKPKSMPLTFSNEAIMSLSKNTLFKDKFFGELAGNLNLTKLTMVIKYFNYMFLRVSKSRRIIMIMSYIIKPDFNK